MAIVATGEMAITPDLKGFETSMNKSMGGVAKRAAAAFGGAFAAAGAFKATIGAAIDFESSFAGVRKTVDATEAEFDALSQSLRDLAKEIPVNVNELNRIAEAAGQLGVAKDSIIDFTETIALMSVTTNLSADEAANAFARIANITGLPQDQFDNLGSTVVELGNKLAATESELIDFALRIAGAGELAGLTEAQILGIAGAMASVGVEAEAGGTAVQKVLLSMLEAVSTGNDDLKLFAATAGQTAKQFAEGFRKDAAGAFTDFVEGLGKSGDKAFIILDDLDLKDQRLIRSFLSLAGAGDLLSRAIDVGSQSFAKNTALTEEAAKRFETTQAKLQLLKNQLTDIGITVGVALLPVVQKLAEMFLKMSPTMQKLVVGGVALIGTLVLLAPAFAAITTILATVTVAGLATVGLFAGIGLAAAGLAILIVQHWDTIKSAITTAVRFVIDFVKANWPLLLGILVGPIGLAVGLIIKHFDSVSNAVESVINWIKGAWEWANKLVSAIAKIKFPKIPGQGVLGNIIGAIPGFAEGGVVPGRLGAPMLAVVHGGEEYSGVGRRLSGGNVFNVAVNFQGATSEEQAYTVGRAVGRGAAYEMERAEARRAARVA